MSTCATTITPDSLKKEEKMSTCAKPPYLISHPMHARPLFHPTPCMPSPYSVLPHACPTLILSQPMHDPSLFYPTLCMPSPILSQPMHALPLFYPSPCMPFPYSIPAHACPLPILPLLTNTTPSILFQPMHALLTHCHIHLEGMFLLWHLHMPLLNLLTLDYIIIIIYLAWQFGVSLYHLMTSECLLFSFTWTHHMYYTLDSLLNYIYIT